MRAFFQNSNVKFEKEIEFYENLQYELYEEISKLRSNPQSYIPILENQMAYLDNKNSIEGISAYEEAINFLNEQKPLDAIQLDNKLTLAALDLINDIGPKGLITHQDSQGNYVSERIERYCEWDFCINENIEIGHNKPEEIISNFLVDDGIPERANRRALFQHIYNHIGIGCGPHSNYGTISVFVFAGSVRPKGTLFYQYDNNNNFNNNDCDFIKERNKFSKREIINDYQIDDPDAPDNTIGVRIVKTSKFLKGKKVFVTKKYYKLDDGTEHAVEFEEY